MRPPTPDIAAPPFPPRLPWVNVAMLRLDQLLGSPLLVEFWDFCVPHSVRTLPYLRAWHERYREHGLRIVGIHTAAFGVGEDADEVRAACARLGVTHPVVIDARHELWKLYGNEGWPARYLWDGEHHLREYHYGEGAYDETERAIQELLGVERPPVAPLRPEDEPGRLLPAQTADQRGAYSGPYEAGAVWVVAAAPGTVRVNGAEVELGHAGCHPVIEHGRHTRGELALEVPPGLEVHATCFTPGAG